MLEQILLSIWGCMPELSSDCVDMTNASSTYLGIIIGAVIGAVISWWIYNRQQKTSKEQDKLLAKIAALEEKHEITLKRIEELDRRHDAILNALRKFKQDI